MRISPLISVLIPVYNVEKYIERCLLSVLKNTFIQKAEIILINDCSTDSSVKIINRIIAEHPENNIKLYSNSENKGLGYTRQVALNYAKGKYFVCIDSDDWVEPDYLEAFYTKAEETNADLIYCQWFEESDKTTIQSLPFPEKPYDAIKAILTLKATDTVWTKFYRKSIFDDNNLTWDPRIQYMEDTLINIKYLTYTKTIANIYKPLYHYNVINQDGMSRVRNSEYYLKQDSVVNEINLFLQNRGLYQDFFNELNYLKIHKKYKAIILSSITNFSKIITFNSDEIIFLNTSNNFSIYQKMLINSVYKNNKFISFTLFSLKKLKDFITKLKK